MIRRFYPDSVEWATASGEDAHSGRPLDMWPSAVVCAPRFYSDCLCTRADGNRLIDKDRLADLATASGEVHRPVDAPHRRHCQGDERLLLAHPVYREWADQIEDHAQQVGEKTESLDQHVL